MRREAASLGGAVVDTTFEGALQTDPASAALALTGDRPVVLSDVDAVGRVRELLAEFGSAELGSLLDDGSVLAALAAVGGTAEEAAMAILNS
jgi:hypothetical protein